MLADAPRTRRLLERPIAALDYFFVVAHGKPRPFEYFAVDVMPFAESAMAEGRLFGQLRGGRAYFLWIGVGRDCGWGLFLGRLLLVDAVGIFPYGRCVDLVVLAEGELLLVRGRPGAARQEVPRVGCVLPADRRLDHPDN